MKYLIVLLGFVVQLLGFSELPWESLNAVEYKESKQEEMETDCNPFLERYDPARFPGCEYEKMTRIERMQCSNKKMLAFIFNHLKYPEECHCTVGKTIVTITIEKDGTIKNPRIRRSICEALDEAVIAVFIKMPKWIPTTHISGEVREMDYTIPLNIHLK